MAKNKNSSDYKFQRRLIQKAIQISSLATVEEDPSKLAKIAIACSLLSLAGSIKEGKDSDRLIRTASKIGNN